MKTRTGFVSNSSSSSFVVLGIKVTPEAFEAAGGYDELDGGKGLYCDHPEGEKFVIVGKRIGRWDENDAGISSYSLTSLTKDAFELDLILAKFFPDRKDDVALLYGTSYG